MIRRDAVAAMSLSAAIFAGMSGTGYSQTAPVPAAATPVAPSVAGQPAPAMIPGNPPGNVAPLPLPSTLNNLAAPAVSPQGIAPGAGTAALPGMPATMPVLPGAPVPGLGAMPGTNGTAVAIPTPPPLSATSLATADNSPMDTTATVAGASAPSQLYTFLFIEDPDYGVVRQKFQSDVAENLKEAEIQRLMTERRKNQNGGGMNILGVTPGMGMGMPGMDMGMSPEMGAMGMGAGALGMTPGLGLGTGGNLANSEEAIRAAAEWDFYYDQLEMYDTYIRETLIPNAEDLPKLEYTATNALQERQDLFESFQEKAIEQSNDDYNENKEFYERLQKREDRRRAYMDWLLVKQREISDWSEVWARTVFGTRWADGEEVRVDDWYYGTDFNSAEPVTIAMDDREYVISKQPVSRLKDGQLNIISNNLTPYDIIDTNGYLKNPVMETLRGTIVIPPAPPIYSTSPTTGTIEIIGGDQSTGY